MELYTVSYNSLCVENEILDALDELSNPIVRRRSDLRCEVEGEQNYKITITVEEL